ncbi:MAG: glycosyltransferase family 2 protein [Steroidobacteraceae bacterium]
MTADNPAGRRDEFKEASDSPEPPPSPDWFDEEAYLRANPDVLSAVASGAFTSAFDHYNRNGRDWPIFGAASEPHDGLQRTAPATPHAGALEFRASLEALMLSPHGGLLVVGWVDDRESLLERIVVAGPGWSLNINDSRIARFRRTDVEAALGTTEAHAFGFYAFTYTATAFDAGGGCRAHLRLKDGREYAVDFAPRRVAEIELRDTVLSYVATADVFGNRQVEAMRALQGPLSAAIVRHNRDIGRQIVSGVYVERFGARTRKPRASMVVCLYGKPEFLFLQSALFNGGRGFDDYEMIYVSNSAEMAEQLLKDARTGALIYGLPQTVVLLPGNAGFGAANNVAATYASSDRLLIVNPDVFPRDADWAHKHTEIVSQLPQAKTQLFGVPLYYDDGSLMHGGMYFEYDTGLSIRPSGMSAQRLVRVEHYGKGAPPGCAEFTRSRPVPAITGAFISAARSWYEKLGGFTEDYVFGHYEDADLCLKSLSTGVAPWIHDIKLWHLEGKGSTRRGVHEGGSLVNRALFSQRWDAVIAAGLTGPAPTHPLLRTTEAATGMAGKGARRRAASAASERLRR